MNYAQIKINIMRRQQLEEQRASINDYKIDRTRRH